MAEINVQYIPITDIIVDPKNNSRDDLGDLSEIRSSIEKQGINTPVEVVVSKKAGKFELNAGFRRLACALAIGLESVPAVILPKTTSKLERALRNITENVQRKALNPIEEGRAFLRLRGEGMSDHEIKESLGVTLTAITQRVALLDLHPKIQDALSADLITVRQARILEPVGEDRLEDFIEQASVMGFKKLEEIVEKYLAPKDDPEPDDGKEPEDDSSPDDAGVDLTQVTTQLNNSFTTLLLAVYGETGEFTSNRSRLHAIDFASLGEQNLRRFEAIITDIAEVLNNRTDAE